MIKRIAVYKNELDIIKSTLKEYDYQVYLFGSRVNDNWRDDSDLNICLQDITPVPKRILAKIERQFAKSKLPYEVTLTDHYSSDDQLKMIIERTSIPLDDITDCYLLKP